MPIKGAEIDGSNRPLIARQSSKRLRAIPLHGGTTYKVATVHSATAVRAVAKGSHTRAILMNAPGHRRNKVHYPTFPLRSFNLLKQEPIPMRVKRARRADRDYPTLLALVAILLSVAVIVGIIYNYAEVRQTGGGGDLSARISTPTNQQLPADL
jgi:hypothetical protein